MTGLATTKCNPRDLRAQERPLSVDAGVRASSVGHRTLVYIFTGGTVTSKAVSGGALAPGDKRVKI